MEKESIAIVGSGIIGVAWTLIFSRAGHPVRMYDTAESQLEAAKARMKEQVEALSAVSELRGQSPEHVLDRVTYHSVLKDAVSGCTYVQECTPESLAIKTSVFQALDDACSERTVIASSTSNIKSSQFTESLTGRSRCIVCHPVNPPFAIPLVEVVPNPWTSEAVVAHVRSLLESVGQKPVVLRKEVDGFLVNRLQYALLAEAWRLVQDGVAEPEDIDAVLTHGLALRWSFIGPFQTITLNAPNGVKDYCARYDEGIHNVLSTQDNSVKWSQETIDKVHDAMEKEVPVTRRQERLQWRNDRLMSLHQHKQAAKEWEI